MRHLHSVLVLLLLLVFGVFLVVPPEDVPETLYDESEALPYEGTPVFSVVAPQASGWTAQADLSCDSLVQFTSSRRQSLRRCRSSPQSHCLPDSLIIRDHAFRC